MQSFLMESMMESMMDYFDDKRIERIAKGIAVDGNSSHRHIRVPLTRTAGVSFDGGRFKFDFEGDSEQDIIRLAAYSLNCTKFKNNVYWFGYRFEASASSGLRSMFIDNLKGISGEIPENVLRRFIELPLFSLKEIFSSYSVDCFVYPVSQRSQLVSKMISVINECMQHDVSRCSFELVKLAPVDICFDWGAFNSIYEGEPGYQQMARYVDEVLLPKIRKLDYFSLAKNVKPKYRPYITNYLGFPDLESLEKFRGLKGKNILVVDDVNTSGSTLNEILRILNRVNQGCSIFVYTLIGKQ